MKLITERELIRGVAAAWRRQYRRDQGLHGGASSEDIARRLEALDTETSTGSDVAAITGNTGWTEVPACDECGTWGPVVVQIGEPPDYESSTAEICPACIARASALLSRPGRVP